MAKISPVSAKYIIHASIFIEGVVDKPDVIGAIFGQTEGLLGSELELRELQRSGRIGRIEVNVDTRSGKTSGAIIVPSSLDKAETSIIAAALEIIQRIGPCNAKIRTEKIEDVRVSKRSFVVERAKELLKELMDSVMPDSQEIADEVTYSVRIMEIRQYGKDRLPAGPAIDESDEVIVVEGRADVINLLKHGIKNAIAVNGTSVPETIVELSKKKVLTAFVDGDRGGDLIIRELTSVAEIDYVTKAPDGKEVEEITKKEIHKALRSRIAVEQIKMEIGTRNGRVNGSRIESSRAETSGFERRPLVTRTVVPQRMGIKQPSDDEAKTFRRMSEELIGTRGAYILDDKLNILGKVPVSELPVTLRNISSAYAVIFDGLIDQELVRIAENANVQHMAAMDSKVKPQETKIALMTANSR